MHPLDLDEMVPLINCIKGNIFFARFPYSQCKALVCRTGICRSGICKCVSGSQWILQLRVMQAAPR